MMRNNLILGTKGSDLLTVKGAQNDGVTVNGLGGPDMIVLDDVWYANVIGGEGSDVLQAVHGVGDTLKGGEGSDVYFGFEDRGLVITDKQGPSGVDLNKVSDAVVRLGGDSDVVFDTAGQNNLFLMGGGNDEITLVNSRGGNEIILGDDGWATVKIDHTNLGLPGISDEKVGIGSQIFYGVTPDTVDIGRGQADIVVQAPYAWNNTTGRGELKVNGFDASKDTLSFGGNTPKFIVADGDALKAVFMGSDGIALFTETVRGVGQFVTPGVTDGRNFSGVGGYGRYSEKGGSLPAYDPNQNNNGGGEGGSGTSW